MTDVLMPVIGEQNEEAVVTAWMVDEGQAVTKGLLIAEVQAEKVSMEVIAPSDGFVVDRVPINRPVAQGAPICRLVREACTAGPGAAAPQAAATAPRRRLASPAARRAAAELGVDLGSITGTGPEGRITEADVRAAAAPRGMTGLRSVIASNMRRSHAETAPVTLTSLVTFTETPHAITARVVKAAAEALADHPALNGTRDGDVFTPAEKANIGVAIQTDAGLVAPVIRSAAERTIQQITDEITTLAERVRAGEATMDDYRGGTFAVTNLGRYGIDGFTPIIELPQMAILGIGALRRVPAFDDTGAVVPVEQLTLSLTFDHAFVDGAPAAEFLQTVRDKLSDG